MNALLLAAGKATRLGKLSQRTPKCLQIVGDQTLLDRLVGQLKDAGVQEFLINTHHLADRVREHVESSSWAAQATLVHEAELLGTLGTLRANSDFFGCEGGWVLHADNFITGSLVPMRTVFESRPSEIYGTMLTFEVDDSSAFGVVRCDEHGVVRSFYEKVPGAPSATASAATFLFDDRAIQMAGALPRSFSDISHDLIPELIGRLLAVPAIGTVIDIGTAEGLAAARRLARPKAASSR